MRRDDIRQAPHADTTRRRHGLAVDTFAPAPRWGLHGTGTPSAVGVAPARAAASLRGIAPSPRHGDGAPLALHDDDTSGPDAAGRSDTDWSEWLAAWKARLLQAAGHLSSSTAARGSDSRDRVDRLRADIQTFVAALDGGHAALLRELQRSRRLESDVTEARAALATALVDLAGTRAGEQHARHLALHDGLTALPNRRYFRERLTEALARHRQDKPPIAVLYLDLDGFKPINDAHGHDIGDKLLQIIAARLSRTVRSDDMVSRLGGDEFACLIEGPIDRHRLAHLADKLYEAVSAPLMIRDIELVVRPSIGIAVCPSDGDTAERLIESADAAMYLAKRTGSGHAFVHGDASH